MSFNIPKELENKFGYSKKLASGKWFNFYGIKIKLAYAKESKYFKTHAQKLEDLGKSGIKEEDVLAGACKFLVNSVVLDWNLTEKKEGRDTKVKLTSNNLFKLLSQYDQITADILNKCVDNKEFQVGVSKKK